MRALRILTAFLLAALSVLVIVVSGPAPAARADGGVAVANADGSAAIDPTYATELRVNGSGFQAVRGGHGGVYVFFGTVSGRWRPSQGGTSGDDYLYIPDSEARNNRGYQRYIAFPGSDTAGSAHAVMSDSGGWSTTITVPGAVFRAVGRNGATRSVDCRKVTCGIITIGAHGVVNANNETFTPVQVTDLYDGAEPDADTNDPADTPVDDAVDDSAVATTDTPPARLGPPKLVVDRAATTAGHVLSFAAQGLPPGSQVSAVLDDGVAAAGPFLVGDDGRATGVVTLPPDLSAGTHELRLFGLGADVKSPRVRFPVTVPEATASPAATETPAPQAASADESTDRLGVAFFALAAVVLLAAAARLVLLRRRGRRADA